MRFSLGALDSPEKRFLVSASANASYADPGYLLYLRDKTLVAQPFDLRNFALSGEPHTPDRRGAVLFRRFTGPFSVSPVGRCWSHRREKASTCRS